ncbi:MAG: hypothetical protein N4A44_02835 [Alphaproteobacteria bacterium]|jgi:hypothetical protein|nr:hypothetical protein [Alphaproteobacteria bacterium]
MVKSKLTFYRSQEEDRNNIYNFFRNQDPGGWSGRVVQYGLPFHLVGAVINDELNAKKNIENYIDSEYKAIEKYNLYSNIEEEMADSWSKVSSDFENRILEITNKELCEYKCRISLCLITPAWDDFTTINISIKNKSSKKLYSIAYELLLSHSFKCVREFYSKEEVASAWDVWGFAEITTVFMLRDSIIMKLFNDIPNKNVKKGWFKGSRYACLEKPAEKLYEFWIEKKSFREYLDKSISYLKQNHIVV